MRKSSSNRSRSAKQPAPPPLVYSTTIGRAKFPDFMQISSSEKAVIGFDRYGQVLGAIVPIEAVKVLAGKGDDVGPSVRAQIERAANQLLEQMPSEQNGLDALSRGQSIKARRSVLEMEDIKARRARRQARKTAARD